VIGWSGRKPGVPSRLRKAMAFHLIIRYQKSTIKSRRGAARWNYNGMTTRNLLRPPRKRFSIKEFYMSTQYRVHRFDLRMTSDQSRLEQFLNGLAGEIIAIIPNVTVTPFTWASRVDFLLIVEKVI
jgi:hypothetical protein